MSTEKTKITLVKFFGGMLKNIEEGRIDFEGQSVKIGETVYSIEKAGSPLFQKKKKAFAIELGKLFFIPIMIVVFSFFIATSLLLGSEETLLWKAVAILPVASAVFYVYYSYSSMESRVFMDKDYERYSFLFPYASGVIAILAGQPGFYLSVIFFLGVGLFVYEEYLRKEAIWMMSKGITFWKIKDSSLNGFLIIHEKNQNQQTEEKK